ncbi:MAG TPA: phosphate signaling complex protein PhoU [Candidatus Dormibacteraeota bacterium]|nr:phosphate signaling complex protein PhoU [Candidatus Dormibacteraeota bacterium]
MSRHFDELLGDLRNKLLEMSGLVESAIRDSVHALEGSDDSNVQPVFKRETDVNRLELEIDSTVTNLLALEQPVAGDLRFITAAGKINSNLERIGDLAVNIAERSHSLLQHPHPGIRTDIPQLAELTESMVKRALEAFVEKDANAARAVLVSDDAIDDLRDSVFNDLIAQMKKDSQSVQACVDLMFAARSLERIADHATNIAEAVVFMIEGVEVRRHHTQVVSS